MKVMQIADFTPLYSYHVPEHFLGTWISNDEKWMIEVALRGGGYNVRPMENNPNHVYWQTPYNSNVFDNIPTLEKAYEVYKKYSML